MLWTFCPPTIWANSLEFSRNRLKLSADKMHRACELKDQTYKKTRTLHFSESKLAILVHQQFWVPVWVFLENLRGLYMRDWIRGGLDLQIWGAAILPQSPDPAILVFCWFPCFLPFAIFLAFLFFFGVCVCVLVDVSDIFFNFFLFGGGGKGGGVWGGGRGVGFN